MANLINWKKPTSLFSNRNPFVSLQQQVDRAMTDFYNMFETPFPSVSDIQKSLITPSIDIVEDDKNFKVEVEMPGIGIDDIKISANNKLLSIQAKKEISKKNEEKNYVSREISYGSYERHIHLPDYIETDKAKASFKKGMLWITFPKKADAEKQQQEIKIEKADNTKQ